MVVMQSLTVRTNAGACVTTPGLVKKAGDVHPERMTLPSLFFALREFTLQDLDQNPSWINSAKAF
jgi:hypothetical protein